MRQEMENRCRDVSKNINIFRREKKPQQKECLYYKFAVIHMGGRLAQIGRHYRDSMVSHLAEYWNALLFDHTVDIFTCFLIRYEINIVGMQNVEEKNIGRKLLEVVYVLYDVNVQLGTEHMAPLGGATSKRLLTARAGYIVIFRLATPNCINGHRIHAMTFFLCCGQPIAEDETNVFFLRNIFDHDIADSSSSRHGGRGQNGRWPLRRGHEKRQVNLLLHSFLSPFSYCVLLRILFAFWTIIVAWAHRCTGYGRYSVESGMTYEGDFLDDEYHGKGQIVCPDGSRFRGMWSKGKLTGVHTGDELQVTLFGLNWHFCCYQQSCTHTKINTTKHDD